jgi:hypothetical protein
MTNREAGECGPLPGFQGKERAEEQQARTPASFYTAQATALRLHRHWSGPGASFRWSMTSSPNKYPVLRDFVRVSLCGGRCARLSSPFPIGRLAPIPRKQAASAIGSRWAHRDLVDTLRAWRRLVGAVRAARRLLACAQRRRVEWAWAAWQELVFQEGVARGGVLHERQVARRVLSGWHGLAADSRRGAQLKAQMQQQLSLKVRQTVVCRTATVCRMSVF